MFDPQAKQHTVLKRIAIGALIVLLVGAISYGVAMLLKNISNNSLTGANSANNTQQAMTPTAPSAASLISGYLAPGAMPALANYTVQQDTSAPTRMSVKADDQAYAVSVSTVNYALFYAKATPGAGDAKAISDQTTAYLKDKGFATASSVDASTADTAYTTYTDLGSICQLTSSTTSTPPFYVIACANKTDIQNEYASVKKLLDLYQKTNPLDPFTRAFTSTISSNNKVMTTISLTTSKQQHPLLLFAAIDNNWEYLGNIGDGSGASSNGKYSLSASVITAIHQAKYGDFLAHNLQQ
ncbi:MAG TPA: hypothetical protein VIQ80_00940 [Candidatus Saccharimonadales bacterium]